MLCVDEAASGRTMMELIRTDCVILVLLAILSEAAGPGSAVTLSDFDELEINNNTYWLSKNASKDVDTARKLCSNISATLALLDTNNEYVLVAGYVQMYLVDNKRTVKGILIDVISSDGADGSAVYLWRSEPISALMWYVAGALDVAGRPDHCRRTFRDKRDSEMTSSPSCCVKLYWFHGVFSNLKETSCTSETSNFLCKSNAVQESTSTSTDAGQATSTDNTTTWGQNSSVYHNSTNAQMAETSQAISTDATTTWSQVSSTKTHHTETSQAIIAGASTTWGQNSSVYKNATNAQIKETSTQKSTRSCDPGPNNRMCQDNWSTQKAELENHKPTYFCAQGYAFEESNSTCEDVDECSLGTALCNQICVNTAGAYNCYCQVGYNLSKDGNSCVDFDECSNSFHDCDSKCVNIDGSYVCQCLTGYVLAMDNASCTDTDECSSDSHSCNHTCLNTDGSYVCQCLTGYTLAVDNMSCVDVDECSTTIHGCQQTCVNVDGSFICDCADGYRLDADTGSCLNVDTGSCLDVDTGSCLDVDECSAGTGGCDQICVNTEGSYECECWDGYSLDENQRLCMDVDECAGARNSCQQQCVNTDGSYVCECGQGFHAATNGSSCEDVDECQLRTSPCPQICINTIGSYFCSCYVGYVISEDQTSCTASTTPCKCHCACTDSRSSNISRAEDATREAEKLYQGLVLDKSSLSSHRRTKMCTQDDRPSARAISAPWVLTTTIILTLIILSDCLRLVHFLDDRTQQPYTCTSHF